MRSWSGFLLPALFVLLAALAFGACSSDSSDSGEEEAAPSSTAVEESSTSESSTGETDGDTDGDATSDSTNQSIFRPGEGINVQIGRANWESSYFLAEVHSALLRELGYEVGSPADLELTPEAGFLAIAEREIDAWPSGWFPLHNNWLESELTDGALVSERVTVLGEQLLAGGIQGYVVEKSFGERHNLLTLDDLNNNPAAIAEIDAVDAIPGNGVADIYGCPENWTCDDVIDQQIAISGWQNIRQFKGGSSYQFLVAAALGHLSEDEPFVVHLWGPSPYVTQLRPGDNVYWIGVEDIVDDSNPAQKPNGAALDQRPGTQPILATECPAAAEREDQLCPTGFAVVDILVVANNQFIARNPVAAALMSAVTISVIDVSLSLLADAGESTPDYEAAAQSWIAENRELVNSWLDVAKAAAR